MQDAKNDKYSHQADKQFYHMNSVCVLTLIDSAKSCECISSSTFVS